MRLVEDEAIVTRKARYDSLEGFVSITQCTCQYKHCGRSIVATKGHRPRAYCDDHCKQSAYRLRQEQSKAASGSQVNTAWQLQHEHEEQRMSVEKLKARIARLEQELATYREIVDLSDRARMERQLLDIGAQIGYRQFLPADHLLAVGHGEEYWRVFAESADGEELAQAIVRARYYAENLIVIDTQAEVQRLRSRIRELEKQS